MMRSRLVQGRKRRARVGTLLALVVAGAALLSIYSSPAAKATVVVQFTPAADYAGGYQSYSYTSPCSGYDRGGSTVGSASSGTISGGSADIRAIADGGCSSNSGSLTYGGGFWVDGSWSPSTTGTYYFDAEWTFNAIQYADTLDDCYEGSANSAVNIAIGVWDQSTETNVLSWTDQEMYDAAGYGWCEHYSTGYFQGVSGVIPGGTEGFPSSGITLYSGSSYQFRSNVNFVDNVDCDASYCYGCFLADGDPCGAEADMNTQTNFVWTLDWFEVVT
jgi:hypothetical protein